MERYKYNSAGEKRSYFTSGTKQDMTQCQTRQGTALILKQTNKQTRKICKAETHNQNNWATREYWEIQIAIQGVQRCIALIGYPLLSMVLGFMRQALLLEA